MALGDEAGDVNQSGLPALLLRWQVHLRHVTDRALARGDLRAVLLCNEMGHQTYLVGDWSAARPYLEQALAIRRQALGENHPYTAQSLNNLGVLLQAVDDLPAARPCLLQAGAIAELSLDSDHPNSRIFRANLEILLDEMGATAAPRA